MLRATYAVHTVLHTNPLSKEILQKHKRVYSGFLTWSELKYINIRLILKTIYAQHVYAHGKSIQRNVVQTIKSSFQSGNAK